MTSFHSEGFVKGRKGLRANTLLQTNKKKFDVQTLNWSKRSNSFKPLSNIWVKALKVEKLQAERSERQEGISGDQ